MTTCLTSASLLAPEEYPVLRAEAAAGRPAARRCERDGWTVVDGWQFLGPARFSYSLDGPVRAEVQHRMVERIRALVGDVLAPVQSNYLYYGPGDFLGLHHDQERCPVTVIAVLDGDAEPLCTHPELVDSPPDDLAGLVQPGGHRGGATVDLSAGPLLMRGGELPHHRDPHRGDRDITLVTFCFGDEQ